MAKLTDPTGTSFLSYRRSRIAEASLLIAAQHDLGIPTWHDLGNLDDEHTEDQLGRVLSDEGTANAVVWLTPDVHESAIIQRVELPKIQERVRLRDGFFVVAVAAGRLARADVDRVVETTLTAHDWSEWNLRSVEGDPIGLEDAQTIARRVLEKRVQAVHGRLSPGEPITLLVYTRTRPPIGTGASLVLDWSARFQGREAPTDAWIRHLLPAVETVARTIGTFAPGRTVVATGQASLSAAVALGYAFMAPRGIDVAWKQRLPSGEEEVWSLRTPRTDSAFDVESRGKEVNEDSLAVLVSISSNVEPAFAATKHTLPRFRAILHGRLRHTRLITAGEATDIAQKVRQSIQEARTEFRGLRGGVHLFVSAPVGLAMMIGQLLNAVGPVQLYEHRGDNATGSYVPSAELSQSPPR